MGVFSIIACSKTDSSVVQTTTPSTPVTPIVTTPVVTPPTPLVYIGKTSYELKVPQQGFKNIDSIRNKLGIRNKGIYNGNNNLGYCYIDINNDGLEDIFYPYESDGNFNTKPDVLLNKGKEYVLDNSMLPDNYSGNVNNRKTIVGDFNNDSLPDLFLVNSGFDAAPFPGEQCTLLLSDKVSKKYKLGDVSSVPTAFWHGGASGDLNGDGNLDIIVLGGHPAKVLYGDGKGNFTTQDWQYNAGYGYITTEIIDVDKDGKNDIILSGDEGRPAPALYSPSTIFWNKGNIFSTQTTICSPSTTGWGTVMDIACADVDGDGVNEIFLDRTEDITAVWYGGYNMNVYKSTDGFKTFSILNIINNSLVTTPVIGNWMTRMVLYKNSSNQFVIQSDISGCYAYSDYRANPFTKSWIQNPMTKIFE